MSTRTDTLFPYTTLFRSSGEVARNLWSNLDALLPHDEIKFVICDRADYDWARERIVEYGLDNRCAVLLSPSQAQLAPTQLVEWILADRLPVRFQLQLHKILWGDRKSTRLNSSH